MSTISACRSCGAGRLEPVLSLGTVALADNLLTPEQLDDPEPKFPLDVLFCEECSLMQLLQTVAAERLFDESYRYFSSFSDSLLEHSRKNAEELIASRELDSDSLVLEIASNDGYMLRCFVEAGVPVLGIEPAPAPAAAAEAAGIPTRRAFFSREYARALVTEGMRADVVIAKNVLAHVPELNGFVAGIRAALADDGVAVFEVPYVKDLVDHCEFDTIYHEHLCYFSATALSRLFERHGLSLNRVEHYPIHGGSLRLYVEATSRPDATVTTYLENEERLGVTSVAYYRDFAAGVERIRTSLVDLLNRLKKEGAHIAAYGAAAKGTTLLNFTGVGTDLIDFVVDRNVHKQGCFMPGAHIEIRDPSALLRELPDYTLLLAWNFSDEILAQQAEYRRRGGRFLIPIPSPTVV